MPSADACLGEPVVGVDERRDRSVQRVLSDVALIHPRDLAAICSLERARGLAGAKIAAVAERRHEVTFARTVELRFMARERTEEACPVQPMLSIRERV